MVAENTQEKEVAVSDNEKRTKPKYESPTIFPLGSLGKGMGSCGPGSNADTSCTGTGAVATSSCTAGGAAVSACTAGGGAGSACTAGTLGPT
jgi:hypothetical protein